MAGPLRIEFAGAFYHLIPRGNERRPIVKNGQDRARPPPSTRPAANSATEVAQALGYTSHGGVVTAVQRADRTLSRRVKRLGKELANT